MTTKLDDLVGHLAGREGDPKLLEELADPASDASLFLEATRSYSRALIDDPPPVYADAKSTNLRLLATIALILLLLAASIGIYFLVETRLSRIEAIQARNDTVARNRASEIESKLAKILDSQADRVSMKQIEMSLEKLTDHINQLEHPSTPTITSPSPQEVRDGLNTLRREITSLEKGNARQIEDLRASTLEIARLVRLLLRQSQPVPPAEPANGFGEKPRP